MKNWDNLSHEDYEEVFTCGYASVCENIPKEVHETLFSHITVYPKFCDYNRMDEFLRLLQKGDFGEVIRIKGYMVCEENLHEANLL